MPSQRLGNFGPADPPMMGLKLIFQQRGEDWWQLKLSQQENCILREAGETYLPSSQNRLLCKQKVNSQGHHVLYNMSPQHIVLMWFLLYCCVQQNVHDYVSLTARSHTMNIKIWRDNLQKQKNSSQNESTITTSLIDIPWTADNKTFFRNINKN